MVLKWFKFKPEELYLIWKTRILFKEEKKR